MVGTSPEYGLATHPLDTRKVPLRISESNAVLVDDMAGPQLRRGHLADKAIALIGFLAIDAVLVMLATTPAAGGFEISIYEAYPLAFWMCLVLAIACGTLLVLRRIPEASPSRWWQVGLAVVIFANILFLTLPWFRGYYTYGRWDTLAHLGYVQDMLVSGKVPVVDFYPVEHLLGLSIVSIAGFRLQAIPYVFILLFYIVYVLGMVSLSRVLGLPKSRSLTLIALAFPLVYSFLVVNIQPSTFSLFLIPTLIYFDVRREGLSGQKVKNTIPEILLGLAITLFHPVTAMFLILTFMTFGATEFIYRRILGRSPNSGHANSPRRSFLGMTLMMTVVFFAWYLSYAAVQNSFRSVLDWLVYGSGTPLIQAIIDPLSQGRLTATEFASLLLTKYGALLLLLFVASGCFVKTLRLNTRRNTVGNPLGLRYGVLYLAAGAIGVVTVLGYFPEYEYTPIRLFRFAILAGTILIAITLDETPGRVQERRGRSLQLSRRTIFPFALTTALVALSIVGVYASPFVASPNDQVTLADVAGMQWLSTYQSARIPVVTNIPDQVLRFRIFVLGYQEAIDSAYLAQQLPSHFGFGTNRPISSLTWRYGAYLVVFPIDRVISTYYPASARPLVRQYDPDDFELLNSDASANKVYSGGQFEVWFVPGLGA